MDENITKEICYNNKILLFSVVKENNNLEDVEIFKCVEFLNSNIYYNFYINGENKPLSKIYNETIYNEKNNYDYIIFCHDDISIEDSMLSLKIEQAIGEKSEFSICGLAGNQKFNILDKNLWHLMGDKNSMSGAVAHYTGGGDNQCFMTNFGITPKRCILLDGLFLAINVKDIKNVGLKFDEECPAFFNFYDLDFCLQANKLGLKMTTWPIWVVHKSHGLFNNEDWNIGNKYFKNKWMKNKNE